MRFRSWPRSPRVKENRRSIFRQASSSPGLRLRERICARCAARPFLRGRDGLKNDREHRPRRNDLGGLLPSAETRRLRRSPQGSHVRTSSRRRGFREGCPMKNYGHGTPVREGARVSRWRPGSGPGHRSPANGQRPRSRTPARSTPEASGFLSDAFGGSVDLGLSCRSSQADPQGAAGHDLAKPHRQEDL